jgi:hypothetical protein
MLNAEQVVRKFNLRGVTGHRKALFSSAEHLALIKGTPGGHLMRPAAGACPNAFFKAPSVAYISDS